MPLFSFQKESWVKAKIDIEKNLEIFLTKKDRIVFMFFSVYIIIQYVTLQDCKTLRCVDYSNYWLQLKPGGVCAWRVGVWFLTFPFKRKMVNFKILQIFIITTTLVQQNYASSGEVMGCGGFVKSTKSNIDLSRITIGLFEKRGKSLR